jgi:YD repeat-containing protein
MLTAGYQPTAQAAAEAGAAWCNQSSANQNVCQYAINCSSPGYTCQVVVAGTPTYISFPSVATGTGTWWRWTYSNPSNGESGAFYPTAPTVGYRANPAGCQVYVSALFSPAAQCGPTCNGLSDPINPASGAVYDTFVDVPPTPDSVAFKRFYNNTDPGNAALSEGWRHSFSRSITPRYSSSTYQPYVVRPENSSLYSDEAVACTSGFAEIKSRVSTWTNATASYANGACTLNVGATTIGTLPILYESSPTPAPNTTIIIAYDTTRDDGQLISFTLNGTSIVAPPTINLNLQQTSSGYTLTDANDTVETYDTNGKLLSITGRAGTVQTMSYDPSGRLSGVTDSFGHRLTLSYDSQNRLITVTRQ